MMGKTIVKAILIYIVTISIVTISGCQIAGGGGDQVVENSNQVIGRNKQMEKQGQMILAALKEKYGEEFELHAIGGNWGMMNRQTVKARCYPKKDTSLTFNAEINVNTHIVYDKYLNVVVGRNAEKAIEKMAQSLWEDCRVGVTNDTGMEYPEETDLDMGYEEFLKLYPGNWQLVAIYINSPDQVDEEEEEEKYEQLLEVLIKQQYFKTSVLILYLKEEAYVRYDELLSQEYSMMGYYTDKEKDNIYCICGFRVGRQDQLDENQEEMVINFDKWGRWGRRD